MTGLRMLAPGRRWEGQWGGATRKRRGQKGHSRRSCHGRLGQKVDCVPHEGRTMLRVSVSFSGPGAKPGKESALRISLLNKCVCMCVCVCVYIAGRDLYYGGS